MLSPPVNVETGDLRLELSVFLDSCTDESSSIVEKWRTPFDTKGVRLIATEEINSRPKGGSSEIQWEILIFKCQGMDIGFFVLSIVGYAKNKAVAQSSGRCLCFMDADDTMLPHRIAVQYRLLQQHPDAAFTSHGPTVIMPTWFMSRDLYLLVGPFSEAGRGVPEDLFFFYDHIRRGGAVLRTPGAPLLVYRHHHAAATHAVSQWVNVSDYQDSQWLHVSEGNVVFFDLE
ncbi:hypothetical protein HAZT_HAZT003681 [Hyalella azteca]|uniref:Glycosyltransferase 2-like domain-containing protein n=1 Tax=Hyalella azteca TaxID=294128 RepID=A0A6A0HCM2_HYAAZ|nr:hypothetical protein HAZT_HAZT003681 [Hyalella azteca]